MTTIARATNDKGQVVEVRRLPNGMYQVFLSGQPSSKQVNSIPLIGHVFFRECEAVERTRQGISKGTFISAWSSALQKYWPEISDAEAIDMIEEYLFQETGFGHPHHEWTTAAAEDLAKQYVDEYGEERSGERP